jgi:hypothetical protein
VPAVSLPNVVLADIAEALMLPLASYMHVPSSSPGLSDPLSRTGSNNKVYLHTYNPASQHTCVEYSPRTEGKTPRERTRHMSHAACQCSWAAASYIPMF